jgi:hypothetical protein
MPMLILLGFLIITKLISMLVYKFNSDEETAIDMGLEKNENAKFINVLGKGQRELLIK